VEDSADNAIAEVTITFGT